MYKIVVASSIKSFLEVIGRLFYALHAGDDLEPLPMLSPIFKIPISKKVSLFKKYFIKG